MAVIRPSGVLTLSTWRDGECTGSQSARNIVCDAGLTDLANAIGWAGAQDQAALIGAQPAYLTPMFGAVGVGTSPPYALTGTITSGSDIITAVASTVGITTGMVVVGTGVPINAQVTATTSNTITMSATATTSATETITIGTAPSDLALYQELSRAQVSATASTPSSGSGSSTIWQFQFSAGATTQTLTEAGLFVLASITAGSGDLLDHAMFVPNFTWTAGDTMTLSAQIGWSIP